MLEHGHALPQCAFDPNETGQDEEKNKSLRRNLGIMFVLETLCVAWFMLWVVCCVMYIVAYVLCTACCMLHVSVFCVVRHVLNDVAVCCIVL